MGAKGSELKPLPTLVAGLLWSFFRTVGSTPPASTNGIKAILRIISISLLYFNTTLNEGLQLALVFQFYI